MRIEKFRSIADLNQAAAQLIIEAVQSNPAIVLGLATGSSPIGVYQNLIENHRTEGTSYRDVTTFNLDEYEGLGGTNENSYRYFMNKELFDHIDIKPANTHVPSGVGDLQANCEAYEAKILEAGGIDVQLVGIGANGHIAFNEPGTPFDSLTHIANLSQATIDANARHFPSREDIPKRAISMGIQSILNAKQVIMVAFGKSKAEALKQMIEGPVTTDLPASALQKHPNVIVLLDSEAASLLSR